MSTTAVGSADNTPNNVVAITTTKITQSIVMVDQAMAKRWLERNVKNRAPRQRAVASYRNDMAAGRWMMAGDPIRFNIDGDLVDGQHRLLALADLPDVTLPFTVVRGLPREAQSYMDQGIKRAPRVTSSGSAVSATATTSRQR